MLPILFIASLQCLVAIAAPSPSGPQELRGIWVTRWTYKDAQDVDEIMTAVAGAGFNTVFFQVRGNHDAFYASAIEPWAAELTGTLGRDPGWDPLAQAVKSGHNQGLAVHAYINAFTLWRGERAPPASKPAHAWAQNGDWLVADSDGSPMALNEGYVYASPGNPAAQARLVAVVSDIAKRYAVDGIHLDHIRYPGRDFGHDLGSLAAWEAAKRPDFDQWRRESVNAAVAAVHDAVDVPVTAAVWGVYTNRWAWPEVSAGREDYFQDSAAFVKAGSVDALVPMIYWRPNPGGRLDFGTLVADHVSRASGRHIYVGIRADPSWAPTALVDMVKIARRAGANGVVFFEYTEARAAFGLLKETVFAVAADPPEMIWR